MRADVQAIFKSTPHKKQIMFFSATLPKDIRETSRKFMNKVYISFNYIFKKKKMRGIILAAEGE